MKHAKLLGFLVFFAGSAASAGGLPWAYPGIPYTDWAYDPFTVAVSTPDEWPDLPAAGKYFVEPGHPEATDVPQTGEITGTFGRYGYPDRPRVTIPSNGWITDEFPAGTLIWLKGGTYTAANFYPTWAPQFHGSQDDPVWVYGDPTDRPNFSGVRFSLFDSSHTVLDGLQWIGGNTSNGVLRLTRDRPGPTHHITLRNLRFENLDWIAGGGAIVGLTASSDPDAELHDIVAYRNVFKNNGGGFDWTTADNDHHAYKINGLVGGNAAYRIWIIENEALAGDQPDPIDGLFKSLSGNLVQVGDQQSSSGNNHHVFVAGNYSEFSRQPLGWTKRAHGIHRSCNAQLRHHSGLGCHQCREPESPQRHPGCLSAVPDSLQRRSELPGRPRRLLAERFPQSRPHKSR